MVSVSGSALVPCSVTIWPLRVTRPAAMISSALRREAMPAAARIFWRRRGMVDGLSVLLEGGRISDIRDQISGGEEKRDGNTEVTEAGTQRSQRTARKR